MILVQSFCESVEDENSDGDHSDGDAELYEDELMCLHERGLWAALLLRTALRIMMRDVRLVLFVVQRLLGTVRR